MELSTIRKAGTRVATVVGAVVIAAVVGTGALGIAHAAVESVPNNSVNSAKIVNNTVQSIDIKDGTIAPADLQTRIRPRFAHVSANAGGATILQARGVASVSRINAGGYLVTFSQSVQGCGWTATLTDDDAGSAAAGEISVERYAVDDPNTLWVRTYSSAGAQTDRPNGDGFTVRVDCP